MSLILDALALAAVIGAVLFLWRARRPSCADCPPRPRAAETRISLGSMRAAARRAGDRR
jgi:hypothetical protein